MDPAGQFEVDSRDFPGLAVLPVGGQLAVRRPGRSFRPLSGPARGVRAGRRITWIRRRPLTGSAIRLQKVIRPSSTDGESLVVADLVSVDPWTPRFLRIYGTAELVERQGRFGQARYMRITPEISWSSNLDGRSSTDESRTSGPRRTVHRGGPARAAR